MYIYRRLEIESEIFEKMEETGKFWSKSKRSEVLDILVNSNEGKT